MLLSGMTNPNLSKSTAELGSNCVATDLTREPKNCGHMGKLYMPGYTGTIGLGLSKTGQPERNHR
jgi:hypothetical protein